MSGDAAGQVEAWVTTAETQPCFRYRTAPARAALDCAIVQMPGLDRPDLDGRAALRRAALELADDNLDAARALADVATVIAQRAGDRTRAHLARVISARAALRDPGQRAGAAGELEAVAAEVAAAGDEPADRMLGIELGAQLMIAAGEQLFTALDLDGARGAYDRAEATLRDAPPDALVDARFQALQGTALVAQITRAFGRAAERLQSIVRLTHAHGSPRDELEARIALGHMLTQLGKHGEAARHMEHARILAKHAAGVDEQLLATQSAALAALHGKSYGRALDRAYEALELAGRDKRDLASYVAVVSLIALIHQARGSQSDAYLALVYAAASVRQRLGAHAAIAFEAQIAELKTAMGPERFEAMCEEIVRAREARDRAGSE